jgi:hypothetical protein
MEKNKLLANELFLDEKNIICLESQKNLQKPLLF